MKLEDLRVSAFWPFRADSLVGVSDIFLIG